MEDTTSDSLHDYGDHLGHISGNGALEPPQNAKRDPANWSQTQNGSKWQLQTGVLLNNTKTAIPFTDTFSLSLPQKKHFSCASLLGYQLLSTLRFFLFF